MPPPKRLKTAWNARTKSVHTLKKKIRDAERLLKRHGLPADVYAENERALAAWRLELSSATQAQRENKLSSAYRMVRFFERQKATRRLNKLQKEASIHDDEIPKELRAKISDAEVELSYTLHYPSGERYISLFKDPGANTDAIEKRDMIKADISRRIAAGTLGERTVGVEEERKGGHHTERVEKRGVKKSKRKREKQNGVAEKLEVRGTKIEDDDFFEF